MNQNWFSVKKLLIPGRLELIDDCGSIKFINKSMTNFLSSGLIINIDDKVKFYAVAVEFITWECNLNSSGW